MSKHNKHSMSISEAFRMREALSTKTDCDTQPVTTSVENGDMNTQKPLANVPAIYTGPTIMAAFSRPKQPILIRGQAVRLRRIDGFGRVTISYDPSDERHAGCFYSTATLIKGVPLTDLQPSTKGASK